MRKAGFLIVVLALCACGKASNTGPQSMADFMHDIDSANVLVKEASNDNSLESDPRYMNAIRAYAASQIIAQCWTPPKSTATTKHECLDQKGYKR